MVHAIMVLGSDTGISSFATPLLGRLTSRGGHMNIRGVSHETLGAEVLQQQRMAGLPRGVHCEQARIV